MKPTGFRYGNLRQVTTSKLVLTCHDAEPLSSAACEHAMADDGFRPRICRNGACRTLFFLCARCDRGQCYCSVDCRRDARIIQRRCANRRHQQTPEGRLDHRDRQRLYRRRRIHARVTDQGSVSVADSASFRSEQFEPEVAEQTAPALLLCWAPGQPGVRICCRVCGRQGRWLEPFPPPS